jgi:positive regulator of sigma E activity
MNFMIILRFIVHLICWTTLMGYSAYQIVFENEYWAIMMFFIFLVLFILTIKEFSNDRRKA